MQLVANKEQKERRPDAPSNQFKIFFITNLCSHYTVKPFESIAKRYNTEFYFTGGHEAYWEQRNRVYLGEFRGEYLNGLRVGNYFKISWRLFSLFWAPWSLMIKTVDDRFAFPLCFAAAKIRRRPFILWTGLWHHPQSFVHRVFGVLTKFIYRQADAIVVYGSHVKDYLVKLGVDEKRIFIAFHSIDNAEFNRGVSEDRKQALRNELDLERKKVVLYVGRLEECKGLDYLIEALTKSRQNNFCMLFIGCGSQKERLKARCDQGGFDHRFLDYVENKKLIEYYAIADIFVLPSVTTKDFKEPWGLVINEAMNQGCPIVTTDAVGAAVGGLVESGKNGFVVQERDSESLKDAINKLLSDEPLRSKLSAYSRERIKSWTYESMTQGFFNAVEHVKNKDL